MFQSIFKQAHDKEQLTIYRLILIIAISTKLVFGVLYVLYKPNAYEPMVDRYIVAGIGIIALIVSYLPQVLIKWKKFVSEIAFYLFTAQIFLGTYLNEFNTVYTVTLFLHLIALSLVLDTLPKLLFYNGSFLLGLTILLVYNHTILISERVFYFIAFLLTTIILFSIRYLRNKEQYKLASMEGFLRNLLNQSADAIFITDIEGLIIDCNQRFQQMMGSERAFVGKHLNTLLLNPLSGERRREVMRGVLTGEVVKGIEQYKVESGMAFWGNFAISLVRFDGKKYLLGRVTDITEYKQAEEKLRESEERYAAALEGSNDGIWDWDVPSNQVYYSERYKQMLGFSGDEFVPGFDHWVKSLHPDDRQKTLAHLNDYLNDKIDAYSIEFRMQHKDGQYIWVLARGKKILDEHGKVVRMVGSHTDITLRKEAQDLLEGIMNSSPNGIMALKALRDENGEIYDLEWMMLNNIAADGMGRIDTIAGKTYLQLLQGPMERTLFEKYKEVIESGIQMREEVPYVLPDGGFFWTQVVAVKLGDGVAITYTDVTERRNYEENLKAAKDAAESASKAKAEFLATMSHEIRTPMNAVIGMTDLLLETTLDERQIDYVETIRLSGDNLLTLINDILDYSKIDSGNLELEFHPINLAQLIESVFEMLSFKAKEKQLELVYYISQDVPAQIVSDSTRLVQILVNLVTNAVKFTDKGEILVTVKRLPDTIDGKVKLEFSVKDTGIGIPEDKIARLFKLFSQVDSSTTRKYGGTGLGLAISDKLVKLLGGEIKVQTEVGKGSTFTFSIISDTAFAEIETDTIKDYALKGAQVLLLDDNLTNLKILTLQCRAWGMEPHPFNNAHLALEQLRHGRKYDLAIIDILMPNMDGLQVAREIWRILPDGQLPIIALTSLGNMPDISEKHLFVASIVKPSKQSQLLHHIRIALNAAEKRIYGELRGPILAPLYRTDIQLLLVEDNMVNQKVALGSLKAMGLQADVASNGLEAIEMTKQKNYDCILMDVQMPELDGLEATKVIRAASFGSEHSVIIAMTANAMKEDRAQCLEAGMDDYISKPVKLDVLKDVFSRWFPIQTPSSV
ncbi:MAG: PAS domain S-box protein [Chitinophagales bacterium]|nr:PAS domain S-box protein [Chitinophagales bacterium]